MNTNVMNRINAMSSRIGTVETKEGNALNINVIRTRKIFRNRWNNMNLIS